MAIFIGSDHTSYPLKEAIKRHFRAMGYEVVDRGCHDRETEVDYPVHAARVARDVAAGLGTGVLICATGNGMIMVANKFPGVRAALCHNEFDAERARQQMDANVICFGGLIILQEVAIRLVDHFLREPFEEDNESNVRRVDMIDDVSLIH